MATRFGRLTGRLVVAGGSDGEVPPITRLRDAKSLTVVPPPEWGPRDVVAFLDARRAAACTVPVGYLYPFGDSEREFFALKAVLFGRFFKGGGRYRFLFPLEAHSASFEVGGTDVILGHGNSAPATAALLESRADFPFATPHSNGIDMSLGAAVLCALMDVRPGTDVPSSSLPCFSGAACNRQRPMNMLIPASAVRSRRKSRLEAHMAPAIRT